ncbi:efflux RND transporter permease subunit [Niveibacterium umoris]|uniref:HAE1 family hydrophobic/amphiphilic exporter-1 n=1 Tax=Niveibacterium umoris TaxID=1193620 RepID=A0A840BB56_9RHOO|nr:efflux RND transporter permease subunit [Niveibacterium umoris]MBB4010761.1 HAE1 family hydrophobic/amphiphilic exporter-1 [Niveibacterium umoris]
MWLTRISVKNPVFAAMMMLCLAVLGLFAYKRLTVEAFPDVSFPAVAIETPYPGATPEVVEVEVSRKIEEAMNTLAGVKRVTSRSYQDYSLVFVEFELTVNADKATADARDKLAQVRPSLRDDVKQSVISSFGPDDQPIMSISLVSDRHTTRELTERAEKLILKRIQTVKGVGRASLVGGIKREIQIRLDPFRMRALYVGVEQVVDALRRENQMLPAGALKNLRQEMQVQVQGRLKEPHAFEDIVIVQRGDAPIRLRDIATVEDGEAEPTSHALINGKPALSIDIFKVSKANTVEVADGVRKTVADLNKNLPDGMQLETIFDGSDEIRDSLSDVQKTLIEGAILTVFIVFVFLGSWRSTVITGLTLPLALLGSIFMIQAMGFSLNMMTLLALSLCIGLLIDDAIVVRENIVRHALRGKSPYDAALDGTKEIGLAVLATTLTIVAVFLPVGFMGGIIGRYFYQFGLTVAAAVMLSMFVSFTLDPMLSSVWHDPHAHGAKRGGLLGRWLDAFERFQERLAERYGRVIAWALGHRKSVLALATASFVGSFLLLPFIGSEFVPKGDFGQLGGRMMTPTGSSLSYTLGKAKQIDAALREFPEVKRSYITVNSGWQAQGPEQLGLNIKLVPKRERKATQEQVLVKLRARLKEIGGVELKNLAIGEGGGGGDNPIALSLQGEDLAVLTKLSQDLAARIRAIPNTVDVLTTAEDTRPMLEIAVDRAVAADLGISVERVGNTLRPFIEGQAATTWQAPDGDAYDVKVRLPPELRRNGQDLDLLWLASNRTDAATGLPYMIALSQVAKVVPSTSPTRINRKSLMRDIWVLAGVSGRSAGEVGKDVQKVLKDFKLPPGYRIVEDGENQQMAESFGYAVSALALAVIFIYMILASQFGSFLHPLAIMTSLPLSLIGVFLGLLVARSTLSIFSVIGIIMLMGLVTKNAILLVDFVEQAQKRGEPRRQAIIDAGRTRLRPIMMTTFAMVFGMLPVALGLGEGGEQRAPMAHAVIGGVIASTLLTLVVVPVVYTYLDDFGEWCRRRLHRRRELAADQA